MPRKAVDAGVIKLVSTNTLANIKYLAFSSYWRYLVGVHVGCNFAVSKVKRKVAEIYWCIALLSFESINPELE